MKILLALLLLFAAFNSNAQRTMFQRNNNYMAPAIPSLSATTIATSILTTSATSGGNVIADGGTTVALRGVVWGINPTPTIGLSTKTNDGSGLGSFTSSLTGLTQGTTYYVRSFATNAIGTGYGTQISFTTDMPIPTVTSAGGRIWMDRNLGASQVATSVTDALAYGDLYQWGRGDDGHQLRTSGTTNTQSTSNVSGNSSFITVGGDWRSTTNDNLWQSVTGNNNPCPSGFRIPTKAEWDIEIASWSTLNQSGAFASPLKLTSAGFRQNSGVFNNDGLWADYWSSTINGTQSVIMNFHSSGGGTTASFERAWGFSCRCIKN